MAAPARQRPSWTPRRTLRRLNLTRASSAAAVGRDVVAPAGPQAPLGSWLARPGNHPREGGEAQVGADAPTVWVVDATGEIQEPGRAPAAVDFPGQGTQSGCHTLRQNGEKISVRFLCGSCAVPVRFLTARGTLPLGVALLVVALLGAGVVVLVGSLDAPAPSRRSRRSRRSPAPASRHDSHALLPPQGRGQVLAAERRWAGPDRVQPADRLRVASAHHPRTGTPDADLAGQVLETDAGRGGGCEVLSASVLIQTEVGKAAQVVGAIRAIEGVQWAEAVTGPYDGVARAQAPGIDELGRL